jgi:hypothetical protein
MERPPPSLLSWAAFGPRWGDPERTPAYRPATRSPASAGLRIGAFPFSSLLHLPACYRVVDGPVEDGIIKCRRPKEDHSARPGVSPLSTPTLDLAFPREGRRAAPQARAGGVGGRYPQASVSGSATARDAAQGLMANRSRILRRVRPAGQEYRSSLACRPPGSHTFVTKSA